MEELNTSFTKCCVDAELDTDDASSDGLVTAMGFLLKDAALQNRGTAFQPDQMRYSRLERKTKHDLINMVLNFGWFSHTVVEPFVKNASQKKASLKNASLKNACLDWRNLYDLEKKNVDTLTEEKKRVDGELAASQAKLTELQQKVISLQDELLEEKNKTIGKLVGSVQTTVKDELKSYATVVQNSCSASLAPAKLQAAMKKVSTEEERLCNMIVYGLEEADNENTEDVVLEVIQHTGEKPKLVGCRRLGERSGEKARPIRVTFHTREMVRCVLAKSANLKEVEGYSRVYLSPDRTLEQRKERKKLLGVLSGKRDLYPEKKFGIRRGVVAELN